MEKQLFAYTRVSTARQGERGVSLQEQRDAIERYAKRYGLAINQWFEERESAAKRGRTVFTRMLKLIRQGKAHGVIIHKIDRSARNLKDWADLGEMIDAGVEVHFANESLDLNTRGGRLSADIQAVVAADYIRNLREETKKGFYGRLKQGLFPIPAPVGYCDRGKGKPKEPDPVMAPLVAEAFALYATGNFSLHRLLGVMHERGLRNRRGSKVSMNGLSTILNNPFYTGLMRVNTTGEVFPGIHQPIVSKSLFDRVQNVLNGKTVIRTAIHDFTFRKTFQCSKCRYSLIGERQKGRVYYRCHTRECPTVAVREEEIEDVVQPLLRQLELSPDEIDFVRRWVSQAQTGQTDNRQNKMKELTFRIEAVRGRLHRLTDAMIEGVVEKPLFQDRKNALLQEEQALKDQLGAWERTGNLGLEKLEKFLELIKNASELYKTADNEGKRDLVRELTSNRTVSEEKITIEPKLFVRIVAERSNSTNGRPSQGVHRTWLPLLKKLVKLFDVEPSEVN